jgi:hypothetical protein
MDLFKQRNAFKATSYDHNASNVVTLRNRSSLSKMLNRYSRRKLKQELKFEVKEVS